MRKIGDEPVSESEQATEIAEEFDLIAMARSAIDSIEPAIRSKVFEICDEFNIPVENRERVLWWMHRLTNFERKLKSKIKTPKRRRDDLSKLAQLSETLLSVFSELDVEDVCKLYERAFDMARTPPVQFITDGLSDCQQMLILLRCAALSVRDGSDELKVKAGGRKPIMGHYAGLVSGLWGAVAEVDDMKPGRGGRFEEFCGEVFKVAGIHAGAEGAVRAFSEKQAKKTGVNQP